MAWGRVTSPRAPQEKSDRMLRIIILSVGLLFLDMASRLAFAAISSILILLGIGFETACGEGVGKRRILNAFQYILYGLMVVYFSVEFIAQISAVM